MSRKEKLIQKLKSGSLDFTIDDAEILLSYCGYSVDHKGKTGGSRIRFYNPETGRKILMHRPHPGVTLKRYQIRELITYLEEEELI